MGGAVAEPGRRLWWWGAAVVIDVAGTWLAHPWPRRRLHTENVPFDSAHMAERLRLFLLIALGEAVLTTGTAISESPSDLLTLVAGAAAFAVVACLWALYFGGSEYIVEHHITQTTNPVWSARMAGNGAYLVVAGLVAVAVGCELVITHPHGHGTPGLAILLFGGSFLYVAIQTWYLRITTRHRFTARWIGCAALAAAAPLAILLPALASLSLLVVILLTLTAYVLRHRYAH
jgi:low temperature requirement protein LtrA